MYAIIETGGKQERVAVGDILCVERIQKKKEITFPHVLLISEKGSLKVGTPYVKGAKVSAQVLGQVRGKKVIAFKSRRRKSSRTKQGHRQELTKVKVTDIVS